MHPECLPEWERDYCPVCNKPVRIFNREDLPEDIQSEIYVPGEEMDITPETDEEATAHRQELEQWLTEHKEEKERRERQN